MIGILRGFTEPYFIMTIGFPGVGKSTWIKSESAIRSSKPVDIMSTDDIIERIAAEKGSTYSEVFMDSYKEAEAEMWNKFADSQYARNNIIWDQTNLNKKSRAKKLLSLPLGYTKIAIVFEVHSEWQNWLKKREATGKIIPQDVINKMVSSYEYPSLDEGFDIIIRHIHTEGPANVIVGG